MNFPEEFTKRLNVQPGLNSETLLKALSEPSPVSIRVNTGKWHGEPVNGTRVPWCDSGWYLDKRPSYTLDPLFHSGCYYPQEASGMFVGEAFRQVSGKESGIRVLDLCGAPGGKSTHMSALIGEHGVLIANEVIRSRAGILAGSLSRWGKGNNIVTNNDPSSFSHLKSYFDIILADAPCSGEGMFRDDIAVKEWSVSNAALCSDRQKRIISDVWPSLREGGFLIYSTCTFNPAENEENIKWLVDTFEAESVKIDTGQFNGIHEMSFKGITGYGFYPGRIRGEGFFLSVIRKRGKKEDRELVTSKQFRKMEIREERGSSGKFLRKDVPLVIREGDDFFALPIHADEYGSLSQKLNIIKKGTHLYQIKRDDIIPTHELVLSELLSSTAFPYAELDYRNALSFLRKDNIMAPGLPDGWVIVTYLGVNLGLIKNIGSRINNYFPVGWRIRMASGKDKAEIIRWNTQNR